jgi:voltage-gated potassium channel
LVAVLKLLLVSLALTGITVFVHGIGTLGCIVLMIRVWKTGRYSRNILGVENLVMRLVCLLLLLHLAEAGIWALFYVFSGSLPDFETAAYYSLTSYATLGYGDVVLSEPWRLLGPIEAAVGILMMGWSTGILVTVILRAYANRFPVMITDEDGSRKLREKTGRISHEGGADMDRSGQRTAGTS